MKWYTYLICAIFIIAGIFCGTMLFKEMKAESYVNGSIDITNKFSQTTFKYGNNTIVFYDDLYDETDTFYFSIDLLKTEDFNGEEKKYEVTLNDFVLFCDINPGSIYSTFDIEFYDTEGNCLNQSSMDISILFLNSATRLTLSTEGSESASFLQQYFTDYGMKLKVTEIF